MTEYYDKHNAEDLLYIQMVRYRAADAVILANRRLEDVTVKFGQTDVEGISFVRVFHMRDGSIATEPGYGNPDILGPETTVDPAYALLGFFNAAGEPIGMISNFACHATADRPEQRGEPEGVVSADYPGELAARMKALYGPNFVSVFLNGCCGNVGPGDYSVPLQKNRAQYMGRVLADAARRLLEEGETLRHPVLRSKQDAFSVPRRFPTEQELAEAEALLKRPLDGTMKRGNAPWLLAYGQYCATLERDDIPVRVQAIRLGDVALYALPAEVFNHYSKQLKAASPRKRQMVSELGNGGFQYVVPPHLVGTDVFEAQPNCNIYAPETGEILVDRALRLARALWEEA